MLTWQGMVPTALGCHNRVTSPALPFSCPAPEYIPLLGAIPSQLGCPCSPLARGRQVEPLILSDLDTQGTGSNPFSTTVTLQL